MNFKRWKLGMCVAAGSALLTAGAGLIEPGMHWRGFVAVFCLSAGTNFAAFLVKHPVEEVSFDTTLTKKIDPNEKSNP